MGEVVEHIRHHHEVFVSRERAHGRDHAREAAEQSVRIDAPTVEQQRQPWIGARGVVEQIQRAMTAQSVNSRQEADGRRAEVGRRKNDGPRAVEHVLRVGRAFVTHAVFEKRAQ